MLAFLRANLRWVGAGLVLTYASGIGQTWFIALFAGQIKAEHQLTDGTWGMLHTAATLASALLLLARGGLADTVPPQRLAPIVAAILALAAIGMALAPSAWLLLLVLFGLRFCGQGMLSHIAMTVMGRWFEANRGRAISLASLGYPLAEMTLPPLAVLGIALLGWRETWGVASAVLLLGFAPAMFWLLVKPRIPQGAEGSDGHIPGLGGRHWTRAEVLAHPLFRALLPGVLIPGFVGTVIVFHQVTLAQTNGWSLIAMAPAYTIYAMVLVAVSLTAGWAIDRFGPPRLLPFYLIPMGIACVIIGLGDAVWSWYLGLVVMAFSTGVNNTLWSAYLPMLYGTRYLGAVRALLSTVMIVATAVGPGVTGVLIDLGIAFSDQLLAMALVCAGQSALFVGVARRAR